jgi:hypothetical protein
VFTILCKTKTKNKWNINSSFKRIPFLDSPQTALISEFAQFHIVLPLLISLLSTLLPVSIDEQLKKILNSKNLEMKMKRQLYSTKYFLITEMTP